MISRRSLFGLTLGGAVATAIPPSSGTPSLPRRLRFEADNVRVKSDL